jgi:Tfp pilus assembly protein PilN
MIQINLLPGKKKPAGEGRFKVPLPDLRALLASVTNPWLLAASGAWVLVLAGSLAVFVTTRTRVAVLTSKLAEVRVEERRFDAVLAQKHQWERVRDSLTTEIGMIRSIDRDRYIWPHILDQVSKALPPYTWLETLGAVVGIASPNSGPPAPAGGGGPPQPAAPPAVRVKISGSTVDIQAYTTFLRQLAASPWLTEVIPASSQTVVEQDRPVTAFSVTAQFREADSVYIHTVPLTESLQ